MIFRINTIIFFFFLSVVVVGQGHATSDAPKISRSQFTSSVVDREPIDSLTFLDKSISRIYFFSEFNNFKNQEVIHQWMYNDQVMAEVLIQIEGPRWRAYSSKNLLGTWVGDWTVNILDNTRKIIETKSFQYGSEGITSTAENSTNDMNKLGAVASSSDSSTISSNVQTSSTPRSDDSVNRTYHSGDGEVVDKVSELLATREKIVSVYFRSGSMVLDYKQVDRIDRIVERLRNIETDQYIVRIEGMASPEGSYESNVELSMGRAESVWKYLVIGQAIDPEVLFMTGLGPINASRSDYDNLRRADIIMYRMVVDFNDTVNLE